MATKKNDQLVDLLWRQAKRKDLYHILLCEVVYSTQENRRRHGEGCPFCGRRDQHAAECLITVITAAFDADTDTVARMIKERYTAMTKKK